MDSYKGLRIGESSYAFFTRLLDLSLIYSSLFIIVNLYEIELSSQYILAYALVSIFYLVFSEALGVQKRWGLNRIKMLFAALFISVTLAFMGLLFTLFSLKQVEFYSRVGMVVWYISTILILFNVRYLYAYVKHVLVKRGYFNKRVAIVGSTALAKRLIQELKSSNDTNYKIKAIFDNRSTKRIALCDDSIPVLSIDECVTQAKALKLDMIYIALPLTAQKRIDEIAKALGDTTIDLHLVPDFLVSNLMHARIDKIGELDTLSIYESPYHGTKAFLKRAEDIILSLITLPILLPIMAVIAALVKITSPGPIIYKQVRYGLGGQRIDVYKFRSMYVHQEGKTVVQATKNDPRVTPLGRFLRSSNLDELPQIFNVLRGSMSLVGPRPHAVSHNEEYRAKVELYMLRHKVKPGITGWAQVNGWRGETDTIEKMEKRVEFDLQYIRNWSVLLDIRIVLLTLVRSFFDKNAY